MIPITTFIGKIKNNTDGNNNNDVSKKDVGNIYVK